MKVFDKILSVSIVTYLVWICYYRLFSDQSSVIIKQIYFLFEGITFFIVLLRIYIEKWVPIALFSARRILFTVLFFKLFQVIYRVFKISPAYSEYTKANNSVIWSVIGALLILTLFLYDPVEKYLKKWVKK